MKTPSPLHSIKLNQQKAMDTNTTPLNCRQISLAPLVKPPKWSIDYHNLSSLTKVEHPITRL